MVYVVHKVYNPAKCNVMFCIADPASSVTVVNAKVKSQTYTQLADPATRRLATRIQDKLHVTAHREKNIEIITYLILRNFYDCTFWPILSRTSN